jgi:hypothetical protein
VPVVGTMSIAWFAILLEAYILRIIDPFWILVCGLGHINGGGGYQCFCGIWCVYPTDVVGQKMIG